MPIANIGSFAGGLMRGHLAATEEKRREEEEARRKEDQKFQEEQRGRARKDWQTEDEIRTGIAALPAVGAPSGKFVKDPGAILQGAEGLDQWTPEIVTPEMRQRALAGLYRQKGREDLAAAAEDREYLFTQRGREAEDRTFNLGQRQRTLGQQALEDENLLWYRTSLQDAEKNPAAYVQRVLQTYNTDGIGGEGHKGVRASLSPDGQHVVVAGGPAGDTPQHVPVRQAISQLLQDEFMARMGGVSPAYAQQYANYGIQRGQLTAQQTNAAAAMRNALTNEGYRTWLQSQPKIQVGGDGRIYAIDPTGTRQLGVFGDKKPDPNARNAQFRDPAAYDAAVKEYNDLAVRYQEATNPTDRQNILRQLSIVEGKIANAIGRPMQIKAPAEQPELKFVKTENGGYFADAQGAPRAQFDALGQFPMIPFGNDPRADKKWTEVQDKLATAGASLAVAVNASGNYQWAYQSKDGRKWSTWQEAVKPPELNNQSPSGQPVGGSATKEAAPAPTTTAAVSVGDIPDDKILQAFRTNGAAGAAEALLGPRPQTRLTRAGAVGDVDAQRAYDARWQAIQDRLAQLGQNPPAAGLQRPATPARPATAPAPTPVRTVTAPAPAPAPATAAPAPEPNAPQARKSNNGYEPGKVYKMGNGEQFRWTGRVSGDPKDMSNWEPVVGSVYKIRGAMSRYTGVNPSNPSDPANWAPSSGGPGSAGAVAR